MVGPGFLLETFNAMVRQPGSARDDTYLNAPAYYAITGRRDTTIYEGYGAVMAVCRHPHINDRLLVFPEIGKAEGKLAASVLSTLERPAGGVQLARFTETDMESLRRALAAREHPAVEGLVRIEENSLDWRYPVHILDTNRVASMEGAAFAKIRNKCRKVEETVQAVPINGPDSIRAMRAAVKYWEGSMVLRGSDTDDMTGFYSTLFRMMEEWPGMFGGLIFMQGARPVGFTVFDTPYAETANLLANLADASIPGLADWQVVSTCRALKDQGARFLNFGGSENTSLDQFKRKFQPVKSLDLISADVRYARSPDINIRSGPLLARFNPS